MTRTKAEMRADVLAGRRRLDQQTRVREAGELMGHLIAVAGRDTTICAYLPVGSEPGSVALIDTLAAHARTVLLPVARTDSSGEPLPLQWGEHRPDELVDAPFGLREPPPPWLPADTVRQADVVLVPALAVDRRGARLGRGAGFYDRTLVLARPDALLVAVVRDDELVADLPAESHDIAMTHALTPRLGLVTLGLADPGNAPNPAGGSST